MMKDQQPVIMNEVTSPFQLRLKESLPLRRRRHKRSLRRNAIAHEDLVKRLAGVHKTSTEQFGSN
jgi:hypothetical protein